MVSLFFRKQLCYHFCRYALEPHGIYQIVRLHLFQAVSLLEFYLVTYSLDRLQMHMVVEKLSY